MGARGAERCAGQKTETRLQASRQRLRVGGRAENVSASGAATASDNAFVASESLESVYRIAILGPGGVGGFLAGALAHAGEEVVVVAREPTAKHVQEEGIDVRSVRLGDFTARAEAVT